MERIQKVCNNNIDFKKLVCELDKYLAGCDGDEHEFYDQFNHLDTIKNAFVIYKDRIAAGCGALKEFEPGTAEVKRMYIRLEYRNNGYASKILKSLEEWAKETGYYRMILETGKTQVEAIHLYKRNGYKTIENYGPYNKMKNSVCFEKMI